MKNGFTLVELSIVLVIIGLLIGGVLVGQSLIEAVKVQKEVRRLQQYSIAVDQFKYKFKQEAGDSNLFIPPGANDGYTNNGTGSCPDSYAFDALSAWSHLYQSGMLGEKYVWDSAKACGSEDADPNFVGLTPINKVGPYNTVSPYYYSAFNATYAGKMYLRHFASNYKPEILWGLEAKLDDGVPSLNTGSIRSYPQGDFANGCTPEAIAILPDNRKYCIVDIFFSSTL